MDRCERRYRTRKIVRRRMRDAGHVGLLGFCSFPHPNKFCGRCIIRIKKLRGRCRKLAPCDCGHARCFCCHSNKILGNPTLKSLCAELAYWEQLKELKS